MWNTFAAPSAVTARLAAIAACTTNNGSRRNATIVHTAPTTSSANPTM